MKEINRKEYRYTFADGTEVSMTAKELGSEKWIEILMHMDHEEHNKERAETRRHVSFEEEDPDGTTFASDDNVEKFIENTMMLSKFLKGLTELERLTFIGRFMHGYSQQEMAETLETSQQMISWTEKKLREKIKKFYF